ncbi:MAG: c-type cytochrome [Verrucomicrobia bacterium]|nr:c-type cytochrome [Verrucomicrobiota bacterium]
MKIFLCHLAALLASTLAVHAGYRIENVPRPAEMRGGIVGIAFTPTGTLVVTTRYGEVWMRPPGGAWRCFARGLNEPLGVSAESDRIVWVAHRPELLKCTDTDGDGRADTFDTLGAQWGISNNYHEFFFGLPRDRAGNFYGVIGLTSLGDKLTLSPSEVRGKLDPTPLLEPAGHIADLPYRGWAVKIAPDGKFTPLASGFRQTNGVGVSPEGELFANDNQGEYKPSCGLIHVEPGGFYGHVAGLKWEPGFDPKSFTTEKAWQRYRGPAVVFPHGPMGVSGGEPVWDTTGGKFGPYAGQVFAGDYTRLVVRSNLEQVAGAWQGACFPFLGRNENAPYASGEKLLAGVTRGAFAPDGSYYLGATAGWGAGADGIQRVVFDGVVPADIHELTLTARGFRLTFTQPMNATTLAAIANFELSRFRFYYQHKYGSPRVDEERVPVIDTHPAADGRSVELIVAELKPGFVYELSAAALRTADQQPLANPLAYYTANRLLDGSRVTGDTTRLPRPGETAGGAKDADLKTTASPAALVAAGEKVYRLYCVPCHQPDGRGIPGGAANFRDDKTRLAKTDTELLKVMATGLDTKGMPPFEAILSVPQRKAVLAYIREAFGEKK